jgi:RimJ/RimL family protein N-acetyltransferase
MSSHLKLRPLERSDLRFAHELNNNAKIMRYWFEEPYETFSELTPLYDQYLECGYLSTIFSRKTHRPEFRSKAI